MGRPPRREGAPLPTGPKGLDVLDDPGTAWPVRDAMTRRWEGGRPLVREPDPPVYVREQVKLTLDPAAWRIGFLEVHDAAISPALYSDLRELAPQALLRDLHRPVKEFFMTPEPVEGTDVRGAIRDASRAIATAMRGEPRAEIVPLTNAVREMQEYRRSLLSAPWRPLKPDDAPRAPIAASYPRDEGGGG